MPANRNYIPFTDFFFFTWSIFKINTSCCGEGFWCPKQRFMTSGEGISRTSTEISYRNESALMAVSCTSNRPVSAEELKKCSFKSLMQL